MRARSVQDRVERGGSAKMFPLDSYELGPPNLRNYALTLTVYQHISAFPVRSEKNGLAVYVRF